MALISILHPRAGRRGFARRAALALGWVLLQASLADAFSAQLPHAAPLESLAIAQKAAQSGTVGIELKPEDFVDLLRNDPDLRRFAALRIEDQWQPEFVPMLLEVLQLVREPDYRAELFALLERTTQQAGIARSGNDWFEWYWKDEQRQTWAHYAEFKKQLYRLIDPRFEAYFSTERSATIALDEVRWGGVGQNGIPPLHSPKMIPATQAKYLSPRDVVFGLEIDGDARAYPKRILAWHEMFTDKVGGVAVAGVYCTLCGSMVLFETELGGTTHQLGTSGFLFRSNKLMFDEATQSLWNTLWGTPAIGPLVGQGIELERRSVVTTTWREWMKRHPDTTVLSLDTGHQRDYSEGAAYRQYFATDELMFAVSKRDDRLANKAEVFCLLVGVPDPLPLAISADFLGRHPVHHFEHGGVEGVILTDKSGANRAYRSNGLRFTDWNFLDTVRDASGKSWSVQEHALVSADGSLLPRLAAHRAFWFGWYAAYPETALVH